MELSKVCFCPVAVRIGGLEAADVGSAIREAGGFIVTRGGVEEDFCGTNEEPIACYGAVCIRWWLPFELESLRRSEGEPVDIRWIGYGHRGGWGVSMMIVVLYLFESCLCGVLI